MKLATEIPGTGNSNAHKTLLKRRFYFQVSNHCESGHGHRALEATPWENVRKVSD